MFIWKLAEKYTSPVSVIRRMYSMTISQSELNPWNFTWLACWLFQATSAGGEWPTYLQWFPAAWAFPGWGAAVLRRGGWDHTHSPMAPRTRGFLTQHRKQEQEKDQLSRKKSTPPVHFPHYGTVQTSSVLFAQPHISPASCQKSIFLLMGNICLLGQQYKTPSMPSICVKYFKVILH